MAELRLSNLSKSFGETPAVDRLDLHVREGELLTLLGPSGSGKTTALRLIAGYLTPDEGSIHIASQEVTREPPEKRDIGMVFQSYALFPHRSVFRNVTFGLERRKSSKSEQRARARRALQMVHLTGFDDRYPHELSGGQQQRVALARALVIEPRLLLLDEPLSNLDAKLRAELRLEIRRIQQELGITTLLVTHDQEEALTVSDRIALMREGRLEQLGTPEELYHRPQSRFVAEFIGRMNLLAAKRVATGADATSYRVAGGAVVCGPPGPETAILAVRPEAMHMGEQERNRIRGVVEHRLFLGELVEVCVRLPDGTRIVARGSEPALPRQPIGAFVTLSWSPAATLVIHDERRSSSRFTGEDPIRGA